MKDFTPAQLAEVLTQGTLMRGGLDQTTPTLSLPPGFIRDGVNFQIMVTGGYGRIGGYERYDGQPSPSDGVYNIVQVVSFTNTPAVSDAITQASSGATGVVALVGGDYMVITKLVGAFDDTGVITKAGPTTIGTATTSTLDITSLLDAQFLAAAYDIYRADIGPVPGTGAVLGIVGAVFSGVDYVYAFRANLLGTGINLYKATVAGWSQINFLYEVSFTLGGATKPADDTTLTQGGVTATIRRVVDSSGVWASNTGAGKFVVTAPAGGNFAAGAATIGAINVTLSGIQTAITMTPGGKFEFAKGNFSGQLSTLRVFGCDGTNRAFEFDGSTLVPITTATTPDAPKHIAVHKNILFLAIQSSLVYSAAGFPFRYTSTDGGGEIATGDTITNLLPLPGNQTVGTLVCYGTTTINFLYGNAPASWTFTAYPMGAGGLHYSAQNLNDSYVFDMQGVSKLSTTLAYGNFTSAGITKNMVPLVIDKRSKIVDSCINVTNSQYRVFFDDGYALWLTIVNGKFIGGGQMLFPNVVSCVWNGQQNDGDEVTYFGADEDGYVYQMDVGPSFDGEILEAFATLAWDNQKSNRLIKRYRGASIEMEGTAYADIALGYQIEYGSTEKEQPAAVTYASGFRPTPRWDSFIWDNFYWDGQTLMPTSVDLTGSATNIQYTISTSTNYIQPFTVNSITTRYSRRRLMRN